MWLDAAAMNLAHRLEGCNTAHNHPKGRLCVFGVAGGEGDRTLLESGGPQGDLGDGLPAAVARRAHGRSVVSIAEVGICTLSFGSNLLKSDINLIQKFRAEIFQP